MCKCFAVTENLNRFFRLRFVSRTAFTRNWCWCEALEYNYKRAVRSPSTWLVQSPVCVCVCTCWGGGVWYNPKLGPVFGSRGRTYVVHEGRSGSHPPPTHTHWQVWSRQDLGLGPRGRTCTGNGENWSVLGGSCSFGLQFSPWSQVVKNVFVLCQTMAKLSPSTSHKMRPADFCAMSFQSKTAMWLKSIFFFFFLHVWYLG